MYISQMAHKVRNKARLVWFVMRSQSSAAVTMTKDGKFNLFTNGENTLSDAMLEVICLKRIIVSLESVIEESSIELGEAHSLKSMREAAERWGKKQYEDE